MPEEKEKEEEEEDGEISSLLIFCMSLERCIYVNYFESFNVYKNTRRLCYVS